MCVATHHALVGVLGVIGRVQKLTVLQLLAQPLQGVERLVQLNGHGHLGQVLANVVPEDVPQAHPSRAGAGGWQGRAPARLEGQTSTPRTWEEGKEGFRGL